MPLENLSGDASLDWVGPAAAGILVEQVSASSRFYPFDAADLGLARLNGAHRVFEGYITRSGNQVRIHAVIEDLDSRRNVQALDAQTDPRSGLPAAVESMARLIDPQTRPFGTRNGAAIQAWGEAIVARDIPEKQQALERAIASDPNFGAAYAELARLYSATGTTDRAVEVLDRAHNHASQFTDLERAGLAVVEAGVHQSQNERREALVALSRLVTTDTQTLRAVGELDINARRFDTAVDFLKRALALEPANVALLNSLGYAESYRGNLEGARATLERYRAVQPADANALDSLGEVHFYAGRFAEAAKYFLDSQHMAPGVQAGVGLLKAAQARYLQGDLKSADDLFGEYDKLRRAAHEPVADVRKAEWFYLTGRRSEAVSLAETAARGANPEVAAYALCHLSLWAMNDGEGAKAQGFLANAAQARTPTVQRLVTLCRLIAMPSLQPVSAPPQLQPLLDVARAYSHLLARTPAPSDVLPDRTLQALRRMYENSPTASDGEVRTLYAWALTDARRMAEARPLLQRYYIPLGAEDEPLLTTFEFPHFIALRSAVGLDAAGHH